MLLSLFRNLSKNMLVAVMLALPLGAVAAITDLKLSTAQIFDVQWSISGGKLNTSGFNYIFASINYDSQTASAARWTEAQTADAGSNGRYIGFFNSTTNPGTYGMAVFNSDGSTYKLINNTGSFRTLADGAIFYNGNGQWGTLITTKQGFSLGGSASFDITQEFPTNEQLEAYEPDSSTPLAAGETASAPAEPAPAPEPVYTSAISSQQAARRSAAFANTTGNQADVYIQGNSNLVTVEQIGPGHYIGIDILGNVNTVSVDQQSTYDRHYAETTVYGSGNSVNIIQREAAQSSFAIIMGNDNTAIINQQGTGNHYASLEITGDGHRALISQSGSGSHNATVVLSGSQPWDFALYQDSATGRTYSLPHGMTDGETVSGQCATVGGCSITIYQQ